MEPSRRNQWQAPASRPTAEHRIKQICCRRVRVVVDGKEELDSNHSAKRPAARSRGGSSLSIEARFRGPLVAQTWTGRLAQPCEAVSPLALKVPANEAVPRRSSLHVVVPDSACHAGGRGFESRRSRLSVSPAKRTISLSVVADARLSRAANGQQVGAWPGRVRSSPSREGRSIRS
jgi:hypothetical protein